MDALQKLREYIDRTRAPLPPVTNPEEPLHIDSLSFIRLVSFIETDLDIQLDEDELVAENFGTMRALEKLVSSKIAEAKEPARGSISQTGS